jgi:hypothetical protein
MIRVKFWYIWVVEKGGGQVYWLMDMDHMGRMDEKVG